MVRKTRQFTGSLLTQSHEKFGAQSPVLIRARPQIENFCSVNLSLNYYSTDWHNLGYFTQMKTLKIFHCPLIIINFPFTFVLGPQHLQNKATLEGDKENHLSYTIFCNRKHFSPKSIIASLNYNYLLLYSRQKNCNYLIFISDNVLTWYKNSDIIQGYCKTLLLR